MLLLLLVGAASVLVVVLVVMLVMLIVAFMLVVVRVMWLVLGVCASCGSSIGVGGRVGVVVYTDVAVGVRCCVVEEGVADVGGDVGCCVNGGRADDGIVVVGGVVVVDGVAGNVTDVDVGCAAVDFGRGIACVVVVGVRGVYTVEVDVAGGCVVTRCVMCMVADDVVCVVVWWC